MRNLETFRFYCNYRASSTTDTQNYEVVLDGPHHDAEQFVNWDGGMELDFFTDQSFSESTSPTSMTIGQRIYFSINWKENFSDEMPVVFYASKIS